MFRWWHSEEGCAGKGANSSGGPLARTSPRAGIIASCVAERGVLVAHRKDGALEGAPFRALEEVSEFFVWKPMDRRVPLLPHRESGPDYIIIRYSGCPVAGSSFRMS